SWNPPFRDVMNDAYAQLTGVSATRPIAVAEWGQIEYPGKAAWISNALSDLASNTWPRVKAISYWNQSWDQSDMRINSSQAALDAYRNGVAGSAYVATPVLSATTTAAAPAAPQATAPPTISGAVNVGATA